MPCDASAGRAHLSAARHPRRASAGGGLCVYGPWRHARACLRLRHPTSPPSCLLQSPHTCTQEVPGGLPALGPPDSRGRAAAGSPLWAGSGALIVPVGVLRRSKAQRRASRVGCPDESRPLRRRRHPLLGRGRGRLQCHHLLLHLGLRAALSTRAQVLAAPCGPAYPLPHAASQGLPSILPPPAAHDIAHTQQPLAPSDPHHEAPTPIPCALQASPSNESPAWPWRAAPCAPTPLPPCAPPPLPAAQPPRGPARPAVPPPCCAPFAGRPAAMRSEGGVGGSPRRTRAREQGRAGGAACGGQARPRTWHGAEQGADLGWWARPGSLVSHQAELA